MANSFVRYTGDGSTTTYSVPFSYRAQEDVSITIDGVVTTAFTWNGAGTQVTFTTAPASSTAIEIRRTTSQGTKLVDYASGSVLTESDLDTDSDQAFFMSQEAIDDAGDVIKLSNVNFQWDAQNKRMTNVADPTSAQDAATKNWSETAMSSQLAQATTQATNAATSATNASTSETNAAASATAAAASATAAAASETAAETAETNAETAETNAETAETNAAASASAASTSASNAATSESNASTSATNAASSASTASTAASNASTSETNAAASATNAATSKTNAASSATAAASSASAASTSETNAASSASAASTSATNAATSETNAATSATNAATSETNAATSATAAQTAQAAAEAAADNFDDTYLGAKASDPTLDNDGDALSAGDLYFNTTTDKMRVYDGSAWNDAVTDLTSVVTKTSTTGSAELPSGTTAQRDGSPSAGYIRFNSDETSFEGYDGSAWGSIGGGGTEPSFSARISTAQTVSPSTFTKMACATEDWDTDSKYDATTNYRFTPTVAGYYHFDIGMRGSSSTINIIALYKNGSIWKRKIVEGHKYAQLSIIAVSNATDYFEAYGYTSGTSFDATDTNNWFQAHFVRTA